MTQDEFDSVQESDLVVVRWPYGGYVAPVRKIDGRLYVEESYSKMRPIEEYRGSGLMKNPYNRMEEAAREIENA